MKIAKEFRWEMGHRLPEHFGLCKNIHGHSYKMVVEFEGEPLIQAAPSNDANVSASSSSDESPIENVNDGDPTNKRPLSLFVTEQTTPT